MKKILLIVVLFLSGCSSTDSPIPDDYTGAISNFESSELRYSDSKVDLFFLEKVDDKNINNSLIATGSATYVKGYSLVTDHLVIGVPSEAGLFTITARTLYAAPIQTFSNTVFKISGEVQFSPKPDTTYIVKGKLEEGYAAVWIEEKSTGKVVAEKIESSDNSKLGFFGKSFN